MYWINSKWNLLHCVSNPDDDSRGQKLNVSSAKNVQLVVAKMMGLVHPDLEFAAYVRLRVRFT